ncbi:MAG: undecaprenyl-diphosphate phosphatase [Gammaproteobacteria bacterium]|nr:undecaprenyl-diphosphate phosphatase [Gammaproteobacteria bacterium]
MEIYHLIILGLIQGLTEFLPVSSSAHLILLPFLSGWEDQGLVYDVAAHSGTLAAVIWYFRGDLQDIIRNWSLRWSSNSTSKELMLWYLAVATIPVGLTGLLLHDFISTSLRNPQVIAIASIFFGLILLLSDKTGIRERSFSELSWRDALLVGFAQVLALIPGTSRSGVTITAGLMLGMDRQTASKFSFLLAIPVILLATAYESYKLSTGIYVIDWMSVLIVVLVSFFSALLSIHFFLKLLERTGMLPYVIYRVVLGIVLLFMFKS